MFCRLVILILFLGLVEPHLRTLDKVRLSTLSCKANCLQKYTPAGMQGEFNCFRNSDCWMCWFGCKLFHHNIEAWSLLCSFKSHEICLDGCRASCHFHERDNELDDSHPSSPLKSVEVIEDVKYSYDLDENSTNIEWDYKEGVDIRSVILLVGTNKTLNATEEVEPNHLYILARTYYRNITVNDSVLDMFCTIRLVTIDSEKKIGLLNVHTEHLRRPTNRCHEKGMHHHPPIISSIHVADLRKIYNITGTAKPPHQPFHYNTSHHLNGISPNTSLRIEYNLTDVAHPPVNTTFHSMNISANPTHHHKPLLLPAPTLVDLSKSRPPAREGVLKAAIRWDPFVNRTEDDETPCAKYKVTWKTAVSEKIAGDLVTCSTNTSITVEKNSVYHVWVSLLGGESRVKTEELTVETAHAQYAKLHSPDSCHGCVRGDYATGVSAALASFIVVAITIFLLVKSYRSYTRRDHKLRPGGSFLLPSSLLLSEPKPTMHMIEPRTLTSGVTSGHHVTITPILVSGPEGVPGSSRTNGPYEPLSLEDEDANYFVFDLPKSYTAV